MKIVHLCLCGPVTDGFNYQDNIIPKYHKLLGYDVSVITSEYIWNEKGNLEKDIRNEYLNEYGIVTIRLKIVDDKDFNAKLKRYANLRETLSRQAPDVLFIHGCQFLDIDVVVSYLKKHSDVQVYVDNHADYSNSATNFFSKNILHKIFWRRSARLIEPYTKKFYGVLPARVEFLKELYRLPPEKCELLVMGADDELVEQAKKENLGKKIREQYHVADDDFLVMTGGKIDLFKQQTLMLMEAVNQIPSKRVKLLVFGSVVPEMKERFEALLSEKVIYAGWVKSSDSYGYYAGADLVVFPGRHSVFWEQVVGQGIPMLVKYWDGTTHVDLGGNVEFLTQDSVEEMKEKITDLVDHPQKYQKMKSVATQNGMKVFSYCDISKRAIEQ